MTVCRPDRRENGHSGRCPGARPGRGGISPLRCWLSPIPGKESTLPHPKGGTLNQGFSVTARQCHRKHHWDIPGAPRVGARHTGRASRHQRPSAVRQRCSPSLSFLFPEERASHHAAPGAWLCHRLSELLWDRSQDLRSYLHTRLSSGKTTERSSSVDASEGFMRHSHKETEHPGR